MKTAPTLLLAALALATPAVIAVDNVPAVTNATNPSAAESIDIKASIPIGEICIIPQYGLTAWYYNSKSDGPYKCENKNDSKKWSMLNAYRAGGTEGVHWKYTNDPNDGECLKDWKYYAGDGQELLGSISGRTTTANDKGRWCALPVYRSGGVEGKQWAKCDCRRG